MPLRLTFASSDNVLIEKFLARKEAVLLSLAGAMSAEMVKLGEYIVASKLSGQMLKRRTGLLAESITPTTATVSGGTVTGSVFTDVPYGAMLSEGTMAHTIMARNAKALRFEWNGSVFFRHSVEHPGTEPRPFMSESLQESAPSIAAALKQAIFEALK